MPHPMRLSSLLSVCSLFLTAPLLADPDEPPASAAPAEALDIEALVRRAETIINVVLEHHIDPPTRQEMWLAGTTRLLDEARVPASLNRRFVGQIPQRWL